MDGLISVPTETRTKVPFVGVAGGIGGHDLGCREGPAAVRESGLAGRFTKAGIETAWQEIAEPTNLPDFEAVAAYCEMLAPIVRNSMLDGQRPVVIGGDHSCAMGTWSGAHQSLRQHGPLGLVWIDAHMDSHVPETSPTGNYHGMPLAVLMGHGHDRLTAIADPGPALRPEHLCLIGVRSFEREEAAFLERLGVKVYFMDDVARLGLDRVIADAVAIASNGTAGFGVSIDLDAIDPVDAPGVGLGVPGGIRADALVAAIRNSASLREFAALEVVEFNPSQDQNGKTRDVIELLIAAAFSLEEVPCPTT